MTDESRACTAQEVADAGRGGTNLGRKVPSDTGARTPASRTPSESLKNLGLAAGKAAPSDAAREAIERATAPNGKDAGE